jgi:hypothetical protein
MEFFYIDVTGRMGHYIEELGQDSNDEVGKSLLEAAYRFSGRFPEGGTHATVPIVYLDGRLVGGRSEITAAIDDASTLETVEEEVAAFGARVCYFEAPASLKAVMRAVEEGKVVRVVNLVQ